MSDGCTHSGQHPREVRTHDPGGRGLKDGLEEEEERVMNGLVVVKKNRNDVFDQLTQCSTL